ncbi:MAG: hypothetical protein ABIN36_11865 [Ferruginibacter sp.]
MKKILLKIFVLLLVLLIMDRLFTYFFTKEIFYKTMAGESGGSVNYLIQKKQHVSFLILGSSRAKHHIDPALLSNVYNGDGYNAGINGTGGLIYNSLLLKLLIEKKRIPKLVILQVDAYPYFTMKDDNVNAEISPLYPFIDESPALSNYFKEQTGYAEKIKMWLHAYRFNGKLLNIVYNYARRNSVTNNNGFEGLAGQIDTTGSFVPVDTGKTFHFSEIKMKALQDIAQTCKLNGIRLLLLLPPSYKNIILLKPGNDAILSLLHSNDVYDIFNFSDVGTIPALESNLYWRDQTHLNKEGAAIFSVVFNDSLKSLHLN